MPQMSGDVLFPEHNTTSSSYSWRRFLDLSTPEVGLVASTFLPRGTIIPCFGVLTTHVQEVPELFVGHTPYVQTPNDGQYICGVAYEDTTAGYHFPRTYSSAAYIACQGLSIFAYARPLSMKEASAFVPGRSLTHEKPLTAWPNAAVVPLVNYLEQNEQVQQFVATVQLGNSVVASAQSCIILLDDVRPGTEIRPVNLFENVRQPANLPPYSCFTHPDLHPMVRHMLLDQPQTCTILNKAVFYYRGMDDKTRFASNLLKAYLFARFVPKTWQTVDLNAARQAIDLLIRDVRHIMEGDIVADQEHLKFGEDVQFIKYDRMLARQRKRGR